MIELVAAGAALVGHWKSKKFVGRRLRYTKVVEKPAVGMGLAAGTVTALAAAPIVAVLGAPVAALIVGAGVGTGVAAGIKQARKGGPSEDWS